MAEKVEKKDVVAKVDQPDIITYVPPEPGSIVNAAWQLGMDDNPKATGK